jgi:two-component system, response regulator YesN
MIKIMIIDDEYYFRQALKVSLPYEELGFVICGEAKNGKEALEKIDELKPEIAIVDLNMPIMGGLEFINAIKENGYDIKTIILTGYSEFNYARQAISLGVNNYVLKPVNEEELKKALLDIKASILNELSAKIEIEALIKRAQENIPVLKEKFLNDLLYGNSLMSKSKIINSLEYLGIRLFSKYYRVLVIEIDNIEGYNRDEDEKMLWYYAILDMVSEDLTKPLASEACFDKNNRLCLILGSMDKSDLSEENIAFRCEGLLKNSERNLKIELTIGIGNLYEGINSTEISYREALYALKNGMMSGKGTVVTYNEIEEGGLSKTIFSTEQRSQLLMSMRLLNTAEVYRIIKNIFSEFKISKMKHDFLIVTCIELISTNYEFLAEAGFIFKDIFKYALNPIEEIQYIKSVEEMEKFIIELYECSVNHFSINKHSRSAKMVKDIKEFIVKNYLISELKVEDISKHVFINYSHLCYTFKKETGKTIIEYLTEVRIKKAKEIIDGGNLVIQDVADKVGYEESNYFSRCFKKYYGLSPSKYIESIKNK